MKRNKSEEMREMFANGKTVSEVSHEMNCNYAYCYGVFQRWCDKNGVDYHMTKETKADEIRRMFDEEEMTIGEIAKQLNANYSYVFSVVDKHRKSK